MTDEARVPIRALGNVSNYRIDDLSVDLGLYTVDTVKKVCYKFADRYFHDLKIMEGNVISVHFRFPSTITKDEADDIKEEFIHELVDQDLRETITKETEITRNLILANAFADTKLVDD